MTPEEKKVFEREILAGSIANVLTGIGFALAFIIYRELTKNG